MITRKITSLQHPTVKYLVKLRENRSFREKEGRAVVTGKKIIYDLAQKYIFKTLLSIEEHPEIEAEQKFLVPPEIIKKISGVTEPEGIVADLHLPPSTSLEKKKKILILDRLSDPGNLGTLFRTALALEWEGIFLTLDTADPFNEKAIRSAKGASFFLPYQQGNYETLEKLLKEGGFNLYVADARGKALGSFSFHKPLALLLSHEGQGVSAWAQRHGTPLSIPMKRGVDSLNVATAGAICMYCMGGV